MQLNLSQFLLHVSLYLHISISSSPCSSPHLLKKQLKKGEISNFEKTKCSSSNSRTSSERVGVGGLQAPIQQGLGLGLGLDEGQILPPSQSLSVKLGSSLNPKIVSANRITQKKSKPIIFEKFACQAETQKLFQPIVSLKTILSQSYSRNLPPLRGGPLSRVKEFLNKSALGSSYEYK